MRRRALLATSPLLVLAACASTTPAPPVHIVFFENDSVDLDDAARVVIRDAASAATSNPRITLNVAGFVAPETNAATAQMLAFSRQRADRVAAELRAAGVPANRILVRGRGADQYSDIPLESRRVEIRAAVVPGLTPG